MQGGTFYEAVNHGNRFLLQILFNFNPFLKFETFAKVFLVTLNSFQGLGTY